MEQFPFYLGKLGKKKIRTKVKTAGKRIRYGAKQLTNLKLFFILLLRTSFPLRKLLTFFLHYWKEDFATDAFASTFRL